MRGARRIALLGLLLGAGCRQIFGLDDPTLVDASPDAQLQTDDGWRSGTRLKLRWNDYAGVRDYIGLFDPVLDARCVATPWTDGKRYCAPVTTLAPFDGLAYLDAGCTQAVGIRYHTSCSIANPPTFAVQFVRPGCNLSRVRSRLFRTGALVATPSTFYANDTGTCTSQTGGSSYDFYELVEEIPTSNLVELTVTTTQISSRLMRIEERGSDGSSLRTGVLDTMLDVVCTMNESGTCAPGVTASNEFADSGCTQSIAATAKDCAKPVVAGRVLNAGCFDARIDYFNVANEVVPIAVFQQRDNMCMSTTPNPNQTYYTTTTQVPVATLARSIDVPMGAQQITAIRFTDGDAAVRSSLLYDHVNATLCSTVEGRCLPASLPGVTTYYTDSLCSSSRDFALVYRGDASCGTPPAPMMALKATSDANTCATTYEVYRLASPDSVAVYMGMPGNCQMVTDTAFVRYGLANTVPKTDFASSTVITDP